MLFGGDGKNCFVRETSFDYENDKLLSILRKFLRQPQSSTREEEPKKTQNLFQFLYNRVHSQLVDTVDIKVHSQFTHF